MLTVGPQLSRLLSSSSSARRERRLRGLGEAAAGLGLLGLAQVNTGNPESNGHHFPVRLLFGVL